MYLSGRDAAAHEAVPTRAVWRRVDRNVAFLGLTSLFTDVSSEMITAIAPIYLTTVLGLTALQFGLVDGLYQGVTALLRTASGLAADRRGRHKEAAFVGYALAAVSSSCCSSHRPRRLPWSARCCSTASARASGSCRATR